MDLVSGWKELRKRRGEAEFCSWFISVVISPLLFDILVLKNVRLTFIGIWIESFSISEHDWYERSLYSLSTVYICFRARCALSHILRRQEGTRRDVHWLVEKIGTACCGFTSLLTQIYTLVVVYNHIIFFVNSQYCLPVIFLSSTTSCVLSSSLLIILVLRRCDSLLDFIKILIIFIFDFVYCPTVFSFFLLS